MTQYIIRRILLMIPTLLGVSLLIMFFIRLLPGDAVDILISQTEVQGLSASFKQLADERLEDRGNEDPGVAPREVRAEVEKELIDEELERMDRDPATANDAQRNEAKNALALRTYGDGIRAKIGIDKNYIHQWWDWLIHAVRGDMGQSLLGGKSINEELQRRIPVSFELGLLGMIVGVLIALPTGIMSAVRQDTWVDYLWRGIAIAMIALPSFFLATIIIALAGRDEYWFGIGGPNYSFPIFYKQFWDNPKENLELIWVPAFILGVGLSGTLLRLTRAQMLEVLRQDYIRTARAKGLNGWSVTMRHAVRNALIPIVTIVGLQVPVLIGGSLVLEQIFGIPGVAQYLLSSISNREFPAVIAINMIVAFIIVVSNLAVDVTYAYLDPRVHLS
jgi:peptide/nickel transport system permease protein